MAATFLAYTITSNFSTSGFPVVRIGSGFGTNNETYLSPANRQTNSYWIVILSAQNPRQKVIEWVLPGDSAVPPAGIETYMDNPAYIFVVATNALKTTSVPLDAFYNFLAKYGAGTELQKLEQIHSVFGYTSWGGQVGYILTGPCGPRTPVPPASYETSSILGPNPTLLLLSLASMLNGQPPYGIAETYTWIPRPPHGQALNSEEPER
jgi:hypothetical protein